MPAAPAPGPSAEPRTPVAAVATLGTEGQPESTCVPSSEILGERAKAGKVSLEELSRDAVTRAFFASGENFAAAGRALGVDRRTVERWLDMERLERLRKNPKTPK
jgi:hypothetical protein